MAASQTFVEFRSASSKSKMVCCQQNVVLSLLLRLLFFFMMDMLINLQIERDFNAAAEVAHVPRRRRKFKSPI